eukprot:m.131981 g.131981  ORF g.131981 m.131981 type:complete len:69 (-) comp17490_c0_seq2:2030-2236(-)
MGSRLLRGAEGRLKLFLAFFCRVWDNTTKHALNARWETVGNPWVEVRNPQNYNLPSPVQKSHDNGTAR